MSAAGSIAPGARLSTIRAMSLARVSLVFLLELAFGSLVTLAVTERQALGPKYDKFAGWVLLGLYGLALSLVGTAAWSDVADAGERRLGLAVLVSAVCTLLFASFSGWDRPGLERALLWAALIGGALAVVFVVLPTEAAAPFHAGTTDRAPDAAAAAVPGRATPGPSAAPWALALAAAFGSALVLGFTLWGMILGHWYLVSQGLPVAHLARLVRPLPWLLLAKAAISSIALWCLWEQFLGPGNHGLSDILERSPERILDVVNVWARIPVGLLVPMVLAFMTLVTVRMERTQPATGILYAMTVLVLLGELFGKMIEGSTGVPL